MGIRYLDVRFGKYKNNRKSIPYAIIESISEKRGRVIDAPLVNYLEAEFKTKVQINSFEIKHIDALMPKGEQIVKTERKFIAVPTNKADSIEEILHSLSSGISFDGHCIECRLES